MKIKATVEIVYDVDPNGHRHKDLLTSEQVCLVDRIEHWASAYWEILTINKVNVTSIEEVA